VHEVYGLEPALRGRLQSHFAGFKAPEGVVRYPLANKEPAEQQGEVLRHYGAVMEIEGRRLRLWVPGLAGDDGDWMLLPRRFLGRHARAGATFEVIVRDGDLAGGVFEFQPSSYAELEDLAPTLG
jgi:hypothetical protein